MSESPILYGEGFRRSDIRILQMASLALAIEHASFGRILLMKLGVNHPVRNKVQVIQSMLFLEAAIIEC